MGEADALLDADAAVEAGAAFGQSATRPDWGGLVIAAARFVEYDVRACALLAPGLFRLDLTPMHDTLGVALRALGPYALRWTAGPESFDVLRRGGSTEPLTLQASLDVPGDPLAAEIRVLTVNDVEAGGAYLAARAAIGRASAAAAEA